MVSTFEHRFFHSIFPFQLYLKTFGYFLDSLTKSTKLSLAWIHKFSKFLIIFICFFTSTITGFYQFWFQALPHFSIASSDYNQQFNTNHDFSRIDAFSKFLEMSNLFLTASLTYLAFVLTARKTIQLFCASLERMDHATKRPDLTFLRNYSLVAIVWILTTVNVQCGCALYWRTHHPHRKVSWDFIVREFISIQSMNYLLSAVWLYILCTKVIVVYYTNLADELQQRVDRNLNLDNIIRLMKLFKQLRYTTHHLHGRFGLILMLGCIHLITFCIQAMYFLTRYANAQSYGIVTFWDSFSLIEALSRLFLISYSADRITTVRTKSVGILRQFRENISIKASSSVDRLKLTLYIIELSHGEEVKLLGMLPFSKRSMLKSIETALTFYIIIYQFQMVERYRGTV